MSAAATTLTAPRTADVQRPSLGRLTRVELRKMFDTRAGFWLMLATLLATVGIVVVVYATGKPADQNLRQAFSATLFPTAVLLPVFGILSVTSEWSQRTSLTTFALTTLRERVVGAKLLACIVVAVGAVVVSLAIAALGNGVALMVSNIDASWSLSLSDVGDALVMQVLNVVMGAAFGMALLASAPAIVAYFLVPTIWAILADLIPGLTSVSRWLDLNQTMDPLSNFAMQGDDWARLAVSALVWLGVPLVVGLRRILRAEVS
jgi:ABC-2 type transport system permease protein